MYPIYTEMMIFIRHFYRHCFTHIHIYCVGTILCYWKESGLETALNQQKTALANTKSALDNTEKALEEAENLPIEVTYKDREGRIDLRNKKGFP